MSFKLLASIRNLGLPDLDYIETPLFMITNQHSKKEQLLDEAFKNMAGVLHSNWYDKNTLAYFIEETESDSDEFVAQKSPKIPQLGSQIETHLLFFWFVKDCSVSLEQVYGLFTKAGKFNWWTGHNIFSTSDGLFNKVDFTKEEIDEAGSLLLEYIKKSIVKDETNATLDKSREQETEIPQFRSSVDPYKEENRFDRALTFLKTARAVPHVPQKIAHYMAILECLFSNNNTKIIDNVSKRTAAYLEDATVRGIVKKAYDMRSRFVHGEKMKWTPERMCIMSKQTDDIIRRVLKKIILEDYETFLQENMATYFRQLITKFQALSNNS